ncbi:MAG: hypothetical protein RIG62_17360, partial [Cyclobacteriaceae bacterium]
MRLFLVVLCISWVSIALAQDNPDDPFDWLPELEDLDVDSDDPLSGHEWANWGENDWKEQFEQYKDFYEEDNAQDIRQQAYALAEEEGINIPQRHGPFTYDPETGEVVLESEKDYIKRMNSYLDGLEDELTDVAKDAALEALYLALEPILNALKEKNSAILDAVIPPMPGTPVWDPVEENQKEKKEGGHNFTY